MGVLSRMSRFAPWMCSLTLNSCSGIGGSGALQVPYVPGGAPVGAGVGVGTGSGVGVGTGVGTGVGLGVGVAPGIAAGIGIVSSAEEDFAFVGWVGSSSVIVWQPR